MAKMDWQTLWPMIAFAGLLLLMFWHIVIRPMHRQQRRHHQLMAHIAKGNRIVTAGGIYGTIVEIRDEEIDVMVTEGCVITFDRRAVRKTLE